MKFHGLVHKLKTWPPYFDAVVDGSKTFELRQDDRLGGFSVGDMLVLREWDPEPLHGPGSYTGQELDRIVSYVLRGEETSALDPVVDLGSPPLRKGWVILGLAPETDGGK